jgi:hypothetical protein
MSVDQSKREMQCVHTQNMPNTRPILPDSIPLRANGSTSFTYNPVEEETLDELLLELIQHSEDAPVHDIGREPTRKIKLPVPLPPPAKFQRRSLSTAQRFDVGAVPVHEIETEPIRKIKQPAPLPPPTKFQRRSLSTDKPLLHVFSLHRASKT